MALLAAARRDARDGITLEEEEAEKKFEDTYGDDAPRAMMVSRFIQQNMKPPPDSTIKMHEPDTSDAIMLSFRHYQRVNLVALDTIFVAFSNLKEVRVEFVPDTGKYTIHVKIVKSTSQAAYRPNYKHEVNVASRQNIEGMTIDGEDVIRARDIFQLVLNMGTNMHKMFGGFGDDCPADSFQLSVTPVYFIDAAFIHYVLNERHKDFITGATLTVESGKPKLRFTILRVGKIFTTAARRLAIGSKRSHAAANYDSDSGDDYTDAQDEHGAATIQPQRKRIHHSYPRYADGRRTRY